MRQCGWPPFYAAFVVKQVEIECPVRIARGTSPAEYGFRLMKELHQSGRQVGRLDPRHRIDKRRLTGIRPRLRPVQPGAALGADTCTSESSQRSFNRFLRAPQGGRQIRAERDVDTRRIHLPIPVSDNTRFPELEFALGKNFPAGPRCSMEVIDVVLSSGEARALYRRRQPVWRR